MTEFQKRVLAVVKLVPPGRVMSYSQVAAYIGIPRAARQVGWTLRTHADTTDTPWWRIVNSAGLITIRGDMAFSKELQANLLREEGVKIGDDFRLIMQTYRHHLKPEELRRLGVDARYIETISDTFKDE